MKIIYIKNIDTYILLILGIKKYELRRVSQYFLDIEMNDIVIFQHKKSKIYCKIIDIIDFNNLNDVFHNIHYSKIVPQCTSINNAIEKYAKYYPNYRKDSFRILKINYLPIFNSNG